MNKTGSPQIILLSKRLTGKFIECMQCHNAFYAPKWLLNRKNTVKFCSNRCYWNNKIGKPTWNKGIIGSVKKNITSFKKLGRTFKGTKKEYKSLHWKINKLWGKPDTCEKCSSSGLIGKKIHWANLSGEYLLDRSDWKRLCAKCHFRLDYKHKIGFEYGSNFL